MENPNVVETVVTQVGALNPPVGGAGPGDQVFSATSDDEISFQPATVDEKNRTVDVVWYGGQTVPRSDPDTGEPYMLRLDMAGCRMERLNSGAPVFDCHMSGLDYKSAMANQLGAKAQRGSVAKAWADGPKGLATLQFGVAGRIRIRTSCGPASPPAASGTSVSGPGFIARCQPRTRTEMARWRRTRAAARRRYLWLKIGNRSRFPRSLCRQTFQLSSYPQK